MRINNNLMAMNANRALGINNTGMSKSLEKLSSGLRINRAGDDAAGLSISEKMRAQIRGLNMASKNAQDGISLIQTAEGALDEAHAILQRMRELAVQAANDTNEEIDRQALQNEVDQLLDELDRIANDTQFNNKTLLSGSLALSADGKTGGLVFHIGANADQNIRIGINSMNTTKIGFSGSDGSLTAISTLKGSGITTQAKANNAITTINGAINMVSAERSKLGAIQNRLEHTIKNLDNAAENLQAAESRIRDVDMAKEMMEFTKQTILQQASTAMLAQANQVPQTVLQLLR
ncbi:flagellin Hag [Tepidimicrobium xylanilyticum]|uniref:Flagellin n=1 Tax=Tepidimicrobium xylanilyticum TaxID=1123352 RepID=A0A1H2QU08_9FIRM|nr:flagellin Hag [Tepidimicrobium xylanilyticum]SDW10398.1 flagellin [Tepidimicrobium xylanilyticum]